MICLRRKEGRVACLGWQVMLVIACCMLPWISQLAVCSCWQVSNLGRARNTRGKISHGSLDSLRYRRVSISCGTGRKLFYVHRLVAFAFHGAPSNPLLVVNHIDGNSTSNDACNLEYVTHAENIRHSLTARKTRCGGSKAVRARLLGTTPWQIFSSRQHAADAVGVSVFSVSKCCNGHLRSCRGHEFQFVRDLDLPGEEWEDAVNPKTRSALPGYRISSYGRVEGPTGIRTYGRENYGYKVIWCKGKNIQVHRIMAFTFLDVPISDSTPWEVNHKDGNGSNNSIENLEVVTPSENSLHAWQMRASRDVISKRMPVEGRHILTGSKYFFGSVTEAARHVSQASASSIAAGCAISASCKGRTHSFGGYEWRYSCASDAEDRADEVWKDVDSLALLAAWNVSGS